MKSRNHLVVFDDDIELVTELRHLLARKYQHIDIAGPPELALDLRGAREHLAGARAIVVDLNIGGSQTYGKSLLRKLRRELKRSDTQVIVWSKYLTDAVVLGEVGFSRRVPPDFKTRVFNAFEEGSLEKLTDWEHIKALRGEFEGIRAFVSKASSTPVELMCDVLEELGVVVATI